jgi:hypothetical protein
VVVGSHVLPWAFPVRALPSSSAIPTSSRLHSGLLSCIVQVHTSVSDEHTASVFRFTPALKMTLVFK